MGATWILRLVAALAVLLIAAGPPPIGDLPPLPDSVAPAPAPPKAKPSAPAPDAPEPTPAKPAAEDKGVPAPADDAPKDSPAALRADATNRLKDLPKADDKDAPASAKAIRQALEARIDLLDDWDKVLKAKTAAENPDPNPQKQAEDWKADVEHTRALLAQGEKVPETLIPEAFRKLPSPVPDPLQAQLKEAIEATRSELKDWTERRDDDAEAAAKEGTTPSSLRAARDKSYQRLAALSERNVDRDSGLADARSPDAKALAREKAVNMQLEARIEDDRLKSLEAQMSLDEKRSGLTDLAAQRIELHVQLAQRTLDLLKQRYKNIADNKENELRARADREKTVAENTDDPLERYVAKRKAELLEMEARVQKSVNAEATDPPPSLDEQSKLADEAEADFVRVKKVLDDDDISHLDALRLNNDFRRISLERTRLVRNELAVTAARLGQAENALSAVEFEMMDDARDDRYELENLLGRLPKDREKRRQALVVFEALEKRHTELLRQLHDSLTKLAQRAEDTHRQVQRRIDVLDKHFGFIRTNMFWVRDQEPLSLGTLATATREMRQLARAGLTIAGETLDPPCWGWISGEFLAAVCGLVVLPWPLYRLRRAMRATADAPVHASVHDLP